MIGSASPRQSIARAPGDSRERCPRGDAHTPANLSRKLGSYPSGTGAGGRIIISGFESGQLKNGFGAPPGTIRRAADSFIRTRFLVSLSVISPMGHFVQPDRPTLQGAGNSLSPEPRGEIFSMAQRCAARCGRVRAPLDRSASDHHCAT